MQIKKLNKDFKKIIIQYILFWIFKSILKVENIFLIYLTKNIWNLNQFLLKKLNLFIILWFNVWLFIFIISKNIQFIIILLSLLLYNITNLFYFFNINSIFIIKRIFNVINLYSPIKFINSFIYNSFIYNNYFLIIIIFFILNFFL